MPHLIEFIDLTVSEARKHGRPPEVRIHADNDVIPQIPDEFGPVADDLESMICKCHIAGPSDGRLEHLRQQLSAETVAKDVTAAFADVLQRHGLTATARLSGPGDNEYQRNRISMIIVTLKIAAPDAADEAAE